MRVSNSQSYPISQLLSKRIGRCRESRLLLAASPSTTANTRRCHLCSQTTSLSNSQRTRWTGNFLIFGPLEHLQHPRWSSAVPERGLWRSNSGSSHAERNDQASPGTVHSKDKDADIAKNGMAPETAVALLEQATRKTSLSTAQIHELLRIVMQSQNGLLLERATRSFSDWNDTEALHILIRGWTLFSKQQTTENHMEDSPKLQASQKKTSGAVVVAHLLEEWKRRSMHPPPLEIYRRVLLALSMEGNATQALKTLRSQLTVSSSSLPDMDCFHRVLQACCQEGDLERAMECVKIMQELDDVAPNRSTFKIILQTHAKHFEIHQTPGTGRKAFDFLKHTVMASSTSLPDPIAYNMTLNALALEGEHELAQQLFLEMLSSRPSTLQDPVPLRTVLKACAKANTLEAAERAEELLALFSNNETLNKIVVDGRSYTTVVAIWCQLGVPERAKRVLEELMSLHVQDPNPRTQPDMVSFRTVVGAMSQKIGKLVQANTISQPTHPHNPEIVELATQAQDLIMDMYNTLGYLPNLVTCNTLLNCWSQARQPEAAEDFLQQMIQWEITPDIVTYNTIIACHGKLGNVQECTAWLSKLTSMQGSEPPPNTRTVTAVITALSKQGTQQSAEQAEAWFLQMIEWNLERGWDCAPNRVTLNALLTCWARVGNGKRAEYILRQYQHHYSHQDSPNIVSYNVVLQAFGNNMKKMEDFLEELIAVGLQPNERTVKIAKRALEQDNNIAADQKNFKWGQIRQRYFYFVSSSSSSSGLVSHPRTKKHRSFQRNHDKNNKRGS